MLHFVNPPGLARPQTYTHAVVATGGRLVFIAGQVAEDARGTLVGGADLRLQAHKAFENVGVALEAPGARPEQVARLTIFVVGLRQGDLPLIEDARAAVFGEHKPVDSLIGVQALAHPGCLIEVEATAVLGEDR